jgi:hypothetical protein
MNGRYLTKSLPRYAGSEIRFTAGGVGALRGTVLSEERVAALPTSPVERIFASRADPAWPSKVRIGNQEMRSFGLAGMPLAGRFGPVTHPDVPRADASIVRSGITMRESIRSRVARHIVTAGILLLSTGNLAGAGNGGGGGGNSDPCLGNKYRDICDTFETSLHRTRAGKPRHYNAEHGGFELLTGVPYPTLPDENRRNPLPALG